MNEQWRWFAHAGHFINSQACRFRLHTRVGDYRISTVGDYFPRDAEEVQPIGAGRRTHETMVFRVTGPGEGEVDDWVEIDAEAYEDCDAASDGHLAMCRKYDGLTRR